MAYSASEFSSKSVNRALIDHLIDEAILGSLSGRHKEVAVGVLLDAIQGLAGALGSSSLRRFSGTGFHRPECGYRWPGSGHHPRAGES